MDVNWYKAIKETVVECSVGVFVGGFNHQMFFKSLNMGRDHFDMQWPNVTQSYAV